MHNKSSELEHCGTRACREWAVRGGENIQGYGAGRAVAFEIFIFRAGRASGRRVNGPWRPCTLDHERNTVMDITSNSYWHIFIFFKLSGI